MTMFINQSGPYIKPFRIDPDAVGGIGFGHDRRDTAVFHDQGEAVPDPFGQNQPPAPKDEPAHSLTFRTSPASRATACFQISV